MELKKHLDLLKNANRALVENLDSSQANHQQNFKLNLRITEL
jgi:hypothetical protein